MRNILGLDQRMLVGVVDGWVLVGWILVNGWVLVGRILVNGWVLVNQATEASKVLFNGCHLFLLREVNRLELLVSWLVVSELIRFEGWTSS